MGQHQLARAVADGIDAGHAGLHLLIRLDEALLDLDAGGLQTKAVGLGTASNRQEHFLGFKDLLAVRALDRDFRALVGVFHLLHRGVGIDLHSLSAELGLEKCRELAVHTRQQLRHHLDDRDLGAVAQIHTAELQTDDTAANDQQALRDVVQLQAARGVQNGLALLHAGDARDDGMRARRDDDLLRGVAVAADRDRLRAGKLRLAHHDPDLVGLTQRSHTGGQLLDHGGTEGLDLFPVDLHIGADDADVRAVSGGLIDFRGVEHGLGRHAAAVEAGAAYFVFLNERHLRAELSCADCRNIAAGASADHQNTVFLCCRRCRRCCRGWCGSCDRRGGRRRNSFACRAEPSDHCLAGDGFARRNKDLKQDAVRFRFDIVGQLIRLDREENLSLCDRIADFLLPFVNCPLGHGQAEFRH